MSALSDWLSKSVDQIKNEWDQETATEYEYALEEGEKFSADTPTATNTMYLKVEKKDRFHTYAVEVQQNNGTRQKFASGAIPGWKEFCSALDACAKRVSELPTRKEREGK